MARSISCAIGSALALAGVTSLAPANAGAVALPPYVQAYEPQGVDERGIWMEVDEIERTLRDSQFVIRDEALNSYVKNVFCRTVGEERCRNVRVYVMRIPAFNATMAPNGMMMVWSGLLLRMKSEAEMGAVLGHEFAHFELRHSLKGFKQARTSSDILAWLSVLGSANPAISTAIAGNFYAFNRAQEKDADLLGLNYLAASVYPSSVAPNIWERLMAEEDATAAGRKRKVTHRYAAGFAASHPTELARATYLKEAANKMGDTGDDGAAAYGAAMAKWLPIFLEDQIKLNDFGGTEYLLGQLAGGGWTPELLYARAELYRQRGNPRDLITASQFYQEAIGKGHAGAEAWRGLGFSLLRSQQTEQGKAALRRYLEISPNASDATMISALASQ